LSKISGSSVRLIKEHSFINELVGQVRAGYGLVPFLGSGCSAHSGILMGSQFYDYLAWTVALCVADRKKWPVFGERWDLRLAGWPRSPTHVELRATRAWAMDGFKYLAEACDFHVDDNPATDRVRALTRAGVAASDPAALARILYAPMVPPFLRDPGARQVEITDGNAQRDLHRLLTKEGLKHGGLLLPGVSCTSEDAITERAIRSLYDWRSTLHFLSEVKLGMDRKTLFLEESEASVIDNFNVHITRGKRPNLIHSMLCHLRQPARLRLLLTTNFDTLIEDAFANQKRRVEVIAVSVRGSLPDPEIVHARDTVVKLHGTFSETRADFSLDDRPSLEDRRRFFHYVRGGYPETSQPSFVPGQLLVAGYSGSDARCVDMMKTVLEGDPSALIFWICNSKRDHARLEQLFRERSYGARIIATISERVDLLLYEFQQQLCLTLPPGGGSSYHINHNVAPVASFRVDDHQDDKDPPGASAIVAAATWIGELDSAGLSRDAQPRERKILVVDGPSGVLGAMRGAIDTLSQQHGVEKVWLELEDYPDTPSLAHDLLQIIASRRGVLGLSHAELCTSELCAPFDVLPDPPSPADGTRLVRMWTEHLSMLKDYLGIDPTRWIIALYGRNGPGGCTGWDENSFYWDSEEYGSATQVSPFLAFLIGMKEAGFNVFYAPYSPQRSTRDAQRQRELIEAITGSRTLMAALEVDEVERIVKRSFNIPRTTHDLAGADAKACYTKFFAQPAVSTPDAPRTSMSEGLPWQVLNLETQLGRKDKFPETVRRVLRQALHLDDEKIPGPLMPRSAGLSLSVKPRSYWRFNVLYGASLMRQSRHYSSFFSEGVLQCPKRFNVEGHDNDLLRHLSLEELLKTLDRDPRVFLRKPGGFAWLYRDTRLALRCLVEAASLAAYRSTPSPLPKGHDAIYPVMEFRARAHTHIGEWYLRAFYVSGNAGPLMEAAYHFFQSIRSAPDARSSRKALWRRGLHQLVKTLRRGDAPLRLWFGQGQLASWFSRAPNSHDSGHDFSPDGLRKQIELSWHEVNIRNRQEDDTSPFEEINDTDWQTLELLSAELVQLSRLASARPPIFSFLSLQGVPPRQASIAERSDRRPPVDTATPRPRAAASASLPPPPPEAGDLDSVDDDWWQRKPDSSDDMPPDRRVVDLLRTLDDCIRTKIATAGKEGWDAQWVAGLRTLRGQLHDNPAQAAMIFQELVEWTYLLVCRAKRCEHGTPLVEAKEIYEDTAAAADGGEEVRRTTERPLASTRLDEQRVPAKKRRLLNPESVRNAWLRVCLFANAVVDASSWIAPGIDTFINFEVSKTLGLYGIALARLGRFYEAHRRLNHAEAILTDNGQPESQARIGILELRRGEAYLLEALRVQDVARLLPSKPSSAVQDLNDCTQLVQAAIARAFSDDERAPALWTWLQPQVLAILDKEPVLTHSVLLDGLYRVVAARSGDAWGCFERAEALLGGQTHSSLWWSRLRAMQLLTLSVRPNFVGRKHRPLAARVRMQSALLLKTLWREGITASPQDWYNRLRLLDYYVRALDVFKIDDNEAVDAELKLYRTAREVRQRRATNPALPDEKDLSFAHLENLEWRVRELKRATGLGGPSTIEC